MKNSAIIVVDMLYDFIDGSLACLNACNAVAESRKYISKAVNVDDFDENGIVDTIPVLFIRDHHPANHCSFTENGGIWPVHCVAGTHGGDIHDDLKEFVNEDLTFDKGCDPACEQYSGFESCNAAGQSLSEVLDLLGITDVYLCGIATEFCVRNTAADLKKAGYRVHLLQKCVAYVNEDGHKEAIAQMKAEGIMME